MAQGFHGNSYQHRLAGLKSGGNRTRGAARRGGRRKADDQNQDQTE